MRTSLIALSALALCACSSGDRLPASAPSKPEFRPLGALSGPPIQPTIEEFSPTSGAVASGSIILVKGTGFFRDTRAYMGVFSSLVFIQEAFVFYLDETSLIVFTPPGFPGPADLALANTEEHYVIKEKAFTYVDPVAPAMPVSPVASAHSTLGLFATENNLYTLFPAGVPSSLDRRFQIGWSRFLSTMPLAGSFDGMPGETVGYYEKKRRRFHLATDNAEARTAAISFDFVGAASDEWIPLAGDWNGDGIDTVGLYDPSTGQFHLKNTNSTGPADLVITITDGKLSAPVAGDFNGDGTDGVGIYNPITGQVRIIEAGTETAELKPAAINYVPVVGDWDGTGRDSIAFWDRTTQKLVLGANRSLQFPPTTHNYVPIAGRWRPSTAPGAGTGFAWPTSTLATQRINPGPIVDAYVLGNQMPTLRSLLILRNGKLVTEAYFHGTSPSTAYSVKSVSKSILSALFGIAQREGILPDMTAPLRDYLPAKYFPDGPESKKAKIPLWTLLTMSAGLVWDEDRDARAFTTSTDWVKYTLDKPFEFRKDSDVEVVPGEKWHYSTGLTTVAVHVLTNALEKKTGSRDLYAWANAQLFSKIGIDVRRWDQDASGTLTGGMEMFLTARDMARFGQLYLDLGIALTPAGQLEQVVPMKWVIDSQVGLYPSDDRGGKYNAWWWMRTMSGRPAYFAAGYGGQYVVVVPSLKLVIVTTSKSDTPYQMTGIQDLFLHPMFDRIVAAVTP
jgi:CubicO group peptidase (beta-lactamase class C family)